MLPLGQLPAKNAIETVSVPRPPNLVQHSAMRRGVSHKNLIKISTTNYVVINDRKIKGVLLNIRSLSSKVVLVNELISDHHIYFFCLTETWLSNDDYVSLNESNPPVISILIFKTLTEEVERQLPLIQVY